MMEMYHFEETALVEAPPERVWAAVTEPAWTRWSRGFRRLDVRGGGPIRDGAVMDVSVSGRLPYTLRFTLEVTRFEAPHVIATRAAGDLIGAGSWTMDGHPDGTVFTYRWTVGLANPVLDFLGRADCVKRLLARNHDAVMSNAFDGMKAELEVGTTEHVVE